MERSIDVANYSLGDVLGTFHWDVNGTFQERRSTSHCRAGNGSDCGVHALANAVSILFGMDICAMKYSGTDTMRKHLMNCLEKREFSVFPHHVVALQRSTFVDI